jgi:hypothetical protein
MPFHRSSWVLTSSGSNGAQPLTEMDLIEQGKKVYASSVLKLKLTIDDPHIW